MTMDIKERGYYMKKRYEIDKCLDKYFFLNNRLIAISTIVLVIWALCFVIFIWPASVKIFHIISWTFYMFLGGIGSLSIILIVGFVGKKIYKNKLFECNNCGATSRADKYFCGNCGEKLDNDDLFYKADSSF